MRYNDVFDPDEDEEDEEEEEYTEFPLVYCEKSEPSAGDYGIGFGRKLRPTPQPLAIRIEYYDTGKSLAVSVIGTIHGKDYYLQPIARKERKRLLQRLKEVTRFEDA